MFDTFIAALHCPRCGNVSPATAVCGVQTHLRGDADGSELAVGYSFDPVDLKTEYILGAGYALITPPAAAGTMRLLDVWTCPACQSEQWAAVEIVQGRLERIEAVAMNQATFLTANFISDVNADFLAEALTGVSQAEIAQEKVSSIDILRERLE
jgi:hypothetical protein